MAEIEVDVPVNTDEITVSEDIDELHEQMVKEEGVSKDQIQDALQDALDQQLELWADQVDMEGIIYQEHRRNKAKEAAEAAEEGFVSEEDVE